MTVEGGPLHVVSGSPPSPVFSQDVVNAAPVVNTTPPDLVSVFSAQSVSRPQSSPVGFSAFAVVVSSVLPRVIA